MIRGFGAGALIFSIASLLTFRDLMRPGTGPDAHAQKHQHTGADMSMNLKSKMTAMGPTLKFLYWYPTLSIEGDNYPPPPINALIAQALSMLKMGLIVMVIMGYNPFATVGMATPGFYAWAITNKMYACMMLFFISNAIEGQLISTGAFEIIFNDVPVWSKLENGRVPSPQELFQIVDNHLRMVNPSQQSIAPDTHL